MHSIIETSRCPDVSFYPSGRIDITARVAKLIGLGEGDVIDILRDGKEYYLAVKYKAEKLVGKHKGKVYSTNRGGNNFRTYSKPMTDAMMQTQGDGFNDILRIPAGTIVDHPQHGKIATLLYRLKL